MNFISIAFFAFFAIMFTVYYLIPNRYRWIILLVGSYIFYAWHNVKLVPVLVLVTMISYLGGLLIEKNRKKSIYLIFLVLTLGALLFYKYSDFILFNFSKVLSVWGLNYSYRSETANLPIGLSFFSFQACTYLYDVYKRNVKAEKNAFVYASFVSFFPTVLAGPIQKYRNLIWQLRNPQNFSYDTGKKGLMLFVWGAFEKIAIANKLANVVNIVFDNLGEYTKSYYLVAVLFFSVYIYADFSSYSDMAVGISRLLGIRIEKNFNNPYLSTSLSEFWNRWHISLNEWFIENIYIPLGGNRKGKLRKYINIFVVFAISGLWHGASWHFVLWGVLNGILVIAGQVIKPIKSLVYNKMHINEEGTVLCTIKRMMVFMTISVTWVFFRNGLEASTHIIKEIFSPNISGLFNIMPSRLFNSSLNAIIVVAFLLIFIVIQMLRRDEERYYERFTKLSVAIQCGIFAVIIYICIFSEFSNIYLSGIVDNGKQFIYFQF